ncbi:MAG: hypothetical protein ACR2OC_07540 [Solirubrobacterales bacterium]
MLIAPSTPVGSQGRGCGEIVAFLRLMVEQRRGHGVCHNFGELVTPTQIRCEHADQPVRVLGKLPTANSREQPSTPPPNQSQASKPLVQQLEYTDVGLSVRRSVYLGVPPPRVPLNGFTNHDAR